MKHEDYRYPETDKPASIGHILLGIGVVAMLLIFLLLHWMVGL